MIIINTGGRIGARYGCRRGRAKMIKQPVGQAVPDEQARESGIAGQDGQSATQDGQALCRQGRNLDQSNRRDNAEGDGEKGMTHDQQGDVE